MGRIGALDLGQRVSPPLSLFHCQQKDAGGGGLKMLHRDDALGRIPVQLYKPGTAALRGKGKDKYFLL